MNELGLSSSVINWPCVVVRPPGHHAGPRGAVPCSAHFSYRPEMCSSGFCLVNNVAIGAAHARRSYHPSARRSGCSCGETATVERIAIVDFDIHE